MQKRTRVKICGITQVDDAIYAAKSGADAIGLVFYSKSPRFVSVEQAKLIVEAVYPFTTIVGLFVNAEPDFINEVIDQVNVDLVQFHGDESKADCEAIKRPYMKALRIRNELTREDITSLVNEYDSAKAILLDSYQAGVPGGTGKVFDWQKIPDNLEIPLVLAGGLTASNVRSAVEGVRPYAVDVSGGVEKAKGIKDHVKIDGFMSEVINAD